MVLELVGDEIVAIARYDRSDNVPAELRGDDEVAEISEMDVNPVVVGSGGVVAVDVKVRVAPASARLPADFRRMRL